MAKLTLFKNRPFIRSYHFVDQVPAQYNPQRNPTLLCIHGFPDFWYGWRYQIGPWVRKGCRVVVPDMLGYGGTDKPDDVSEYSTKKICADLAALLDLLNIRKAVCTASCILRSSQDFIGPHWSRLGCVHRRKVRALAS